jgi:hypothetical protein
MLPYYKMLSAPNLQQMSAEIDTYLRTTCPLYISMYDLDTTSTGLINNKSEGGMRYLRKLKEFKNACPIFADWLSSKNIQFRDIFAVAWIVVSSNGTKMLPIHIDTDREDNVPFDLMLDVTGEAINVPLLNYDNSYTVWYSAKKLGTTSVPADFVDSPMESVKNIVMNWSNSNMAYDESSAVELARASITHPMYINVNIPHRALNLGKLPRTSLTIRFRHKLDLQNLC